MPCFTCGPRRTSLDHHHEAGSKQQAVTLKVLRLRAPVGRIAVILTPENDVVQAAGFCTPDVLLARLPPGLSTRGAVAAPRGGLSPMR